MEKASNFKKRNQFIKKMFFSVALVSVFFVFFMVLPAFAEGENLVVNPGFEEVTGNLPTNWRVDMFNSKAGISKVSVEENSYNGSKCLVIENTDVNDVKVLQDLKLQIDKVYKISFMAKGENFNSKSPAGGNLTILGDGIFESKQTLNTNGQWQKIEAYAKVKSKGSDLLQVAMRVGGFGTTVKGKAYFDDVSVELIEDIPDGVNPVDFYVPGEQKNNDANKEPSNNESKGGNNSKPIIIVVIIVVAVGLLVFVELKFAKRGKNNEQGAEDKKEEELEYGDDEYEEDDEE